MYTQKTDYSANENQINFEVGKGVGSHNFLSHQTNNTDVDAINGHKTFINNSVNINGSISSGRTITAANSVPFIDSCNSIGGALNISSDVSNSSYTLNNLATGVFIDGGMSSPVIPYTSVTLTGFVGYSVCNTPGKTLDSMNCLLLGLSDQGSSEQCTIQNFSACVAGGFI